MAAGQTFRPLGVTAVDALAWFTATTPNVQQRMTKSAGIAPDREREVLAGWHSSK